jgi:6,7-dimethyl-8-ribityllumazine synthase
MKQAPVECASARGLRFALLRSLFNRPVSDGLTEGARQALSDLGALARDVEVFDVPGAFELPVVARAAALSGRFDAVIALGAVIKGDTDHYEHVAREAATGIAAVARETGVPVAFGVLTVREEAQALKRAAPGPENKGGEAARAAVLCVRTIRAILTARSARSTPGARRPVSRARARGRRR